MLLFLRICRVALYEYESCYVICCYPLTIVVCYLVLLAIKLYLLLMALIDDDEATR